MAPVKLSRSMKVNLENASFIGVTMSRDVGFGGIERESGKVFKEIVDKRLLLNEIYTFLFKETPLLLSHWLRNG